MGIGGADDHCRAGMLYIDILKASFDAWVHCCGQSLNVSSPVDVRFDSGQSPSAQVEKFWL